jgi:Ser/Thr protein kinase RdoA (MazF antagonist)
VAEDLARRALASLGLGSATVALLKFGTIANFRVENPPRFLKLADPRFRSAEAVLERSLAVSAWLDRAGVPVAAAAEEGSARPVAAEGAWAGLWLWQDQVEGRPDAGRSGERLRRLHEVLGGYPVSLPDVNHLETARRHIAALADRGHLDDYSVEFIRGQAERMAGDWKDFQSELGVGPIHGDFEVDNVLPTSRGPVLIDLDNAQVGPREWDLVKATPDSVNGWREEEWADFSGGYGYDLLEAPGNDVLREVRHLRSLVWMLGDPQYQDRVANGRRLLNEWVAAPQKRCFELAWR